MSANDIKYLVLHCSASRCNEDYSVEQLRRDHKARGFYDIGYKLYLLRYAFAYAFATSTSVRMER